MMSEDPSWDGQPAGPAPHVRMKASLGYDARNGGDAASRTADTHANKEGGWADVERWNDGWTLKAGCRRKEGLRSTTIGPD